METRIGNRRRNCATYRLKPTYEGWKHGSGRTGMVGVRCLKPTYEGWKQSISGDNFTRC